MTTKKSDPKGQNGIGTHAIVLSRKQITGEEAAPSMPEAQEIKEPEQESESKAETTTPSVEDLTQEVFKLRKELAKVPQDLTARIEYFNRKRELIRRLNILEGNAEGLQQHLDRIAELAAVNEFENEVYTLTIEGGEKYSKKQVFALQNPDLIGEVIAYMIGKVEAKIGRIKTQIEE